MSASDITNINNLITKLNGFSETNQVSDGYHTFGELYTHRVILYIILTKHLIEDGKYVWRSKLHDDGSGIPGMFLLGINTEPGEQITYHIKEQFWSMTDFADTLDTAPVFDGHNTDDVLERIQRMFL